MRIELKKDRVSMSENEYRQVMNELNQYKQAYQHCVDDLIVLRANNKRLERENECEKEWFYKYSCELEHIVKHERDTIKRLERENAEQLALLKQFRKLIDYKLTLHQGSSMYREYRSKLDQLGVK